MSVTAIKQMAPSNQALVFGSVAAAVAFLAIPLVPTPLELPGSLTWAFIAFGIVESLGVGAAVVFAIDGWQQFWRHGGRWDQVVYGAIIVALGSWWPHGRAHAAITHDDWGRLAIIEALFHVLPIALLTVVALWVIASLPRHRDQRDA
jgi:hypothetical protein